MPSTLDKQFLAEGPQRALDKIATSSIHSFEILASHWSKKYPRGYLPPTNISSTSLSSLSLISVFLKASATVGAAGRPAPSASGVTVGRSTGRRAVAGTTSSGARRRTASRGGGGKRSLLQVAVAHGLSRGGVRRAWQRGGGCPCDGPFRRHHAGEGGMLVRVGEKWARDRMGAGCFFQYFEIWFVECWDKQANFKRALFPT